MSAYRYHYCLTPAAAVFGWSLKCLPHICCSSQLSERDMLILGTPLTSASRAGAHHDNSIMRSINAMRAPLAASRRASFAKGKRRRQTWLCIWVCVWLCLSLCVCVCVLINIHRAVITKSHANAVADKRSCRQRERKLCKHLHPFD